MVRLILTGLWVCAVTLAAVYLSVWMASAPAAEAEQAGGWANVEAVRSDLISIPVLSESGVSGYFFSRVSLMVDRTAVAGLPVPVKQVVHDELFNAFVGSRLVDPAQFDVAGFRAQIRDSLNRRLGKDAVAEVLIEQLDYLAKDEIRNRAQKSGGSVRVQKLVGTSGAAGRETAGH